MTTSINISVHLMPELGIKEALKKAGVKKPKTVKKLTISGIVSRDDLWYIHKNMAKTLQELDMGNASIDGNTISLYSIYNDNTLVGLNTIVIPATVVEINSFAFCGLSGLTSVVIPDSVVEIGIRAFFRCRSLAHVTIPASVVKIGELAFCECTDLTSVSILNSVNEIAQGTFKDCKNLASVIIPESVQKIANAAFQGCSELNSVIIPDSVVEIGEYAFSRCRSLKSLMIPASVTEIGCNAFRRCPAYIRVHPDNPVYTSKRGKLQLKTQVAAGKIGTIEWTFTKDGVLIISGEGDIPDYNDDLDSEDADVQRSPWFSFCKDVKSIVFKYGEFRYMGLKGLTTFSGFTNLSSVTFNGSCPIDGVFHGFSETDTWDLYGWFSETMVCMLQEFKKAKTSHPENLTTEEWDVILERMIFCFSEIKRLSDTWDEKETACRENLKNEVFELLRKYFENLWW
ncbi:MAG: leucine-rich repeat domain-containing protein [Marinilabiliaceae bacterium]|nr:leucine-rich repeat domain-containing protein [Marinilabiliaceae bacterium]